MFHPMLAANLHAGDTIHTNDWMLHVNVVVPPEAPAQTVSVAVAEFDFLLHYDLAAVLEVEQP